MAIPVYLQNFKAAGIYKVVFDKSTVLNTDTQMLRLVVGYSEKGPFNIPVYIKDATEFVQIFGNISRKLEKRGVYFHRLALQMLQVSPILCLNLKKFSNETLTAATISTDFNTKFDPIETVKIKVEDVFDTTRFWEYDESQLNGLRSIDGNILDQYINIATTDVKSNSCTYFIRKADGIKVSSYNITVNNWYKDEKNDVPDFLQGRENTLISDYFAEIYVFKGKFTSKQVLASETLKNYFIITDEVDDFGNPILKLREKIYDAFGDPVDTLDALYQDQASGAIGHWIGSLIPNFKNKQGSYISLNIAFNSDSDLHHMMMSFNTDLLDEFNTNIDLSGKLVIPTYDTIHNKKVGNFNLSIDKLYKGTAKTSLLGNLNSKVISNQIGFGVNVLKNGEAIIPLETNGKTKISGTMYISSIPTTTTNKEYITVEDLKPFTKSIQDVDDTNETANEVTIYQLILSQVGNDGSDNDENITISVDNKYQLFNIAAKFGVKVKDYWTKEEIEILKASTENPSTEEFKYLSTSTPKTLIIKDGYGTYFNGFAFNEEENDNLLDGPEKVITNISRLEGGYSEQYSIFTDIDDNVKVNFMNVEPTTVTSYFDEKDEDNVYGASVSFIKFNDGSWEVTDEEGMIINGNPSAKAIFSTNYSDKSLLNLLQIGDSVLAKDGSYDIDGDNEKDSDGYYDNAYVQEIGTEYYKEDVYNNDGIITHHKGDFKMYYIIFTAVPLLLTDYDQSLAQSNNNYLIRVNGSLNREIGTMIPQYLEGYTYLNDKPDGSGMYAKLKWQEFILSALTEYKGIRIGLLNKSEIDYRYVIDTFESFPTSGLKKELSYLCKEKQSAFCIANFPAIKTFVKCPYTSFTNSNGVFNVQYIVDGFNKNKSASLKFSLPQDSDGASFIGFYTPLKFSDGYVDSIIPSAGLVSNLFVNKYMTRHPYDIIAGPNYGAINATGLIGPDHKYSQEELQIIEPYGVNCMVYKPNFGTFINANQTAKQTPVSALSKVHVRELVIYLQDEIEKILQRYQWEFNNQRTRNAILDRANYLCELVRANGGLQAYQNIMDESNNTPEIIDNEMAILATHIEPGRGMGKMVHELHIYRTGEMKVSISE